MPDIKEGNDYVFKNSLKLKKKKRQKIVDALPPGVN